MMHWYDFVLVIPVIVLVIAGIASDIEHNHLGPRLNDWPKRRHKEDIRDTHARARQDGRFVDGMITGIALDELEDMFK